jgi:hypothetical protein
MLFAICWMLGGYTCINSISLLLLNLFVPTYDYTLPVYHFVQQTKSRNRQQNLTVLVFNIFISSFVDLRLDSKMLQRFTIILLYSPSLIVLIGTCLFVWVNVGECGWKNSIFSFWIKNVWITWGCHFAWSSKGLNYKKYSPWYCVISKVNMMLKPVPLKMWIKVEDSIANVTDLHCCSQQAI